MEYRSNEYFNGVRKKAEIATATEWEAINVKPTVQILTEFATATLIIN